MCLVSSPKGSRMMCCLVEARVTDHVRPENKRTDSSARLSVGGGMKDKYIWQTLHCTEDRANGIQLTEGERYSIKSSALKGGQTVFNQGRQTVFN